MANSPNSPPYYAPLRPAVHEAVPRRLGLRGDPPPSLTTCVAGTGIKIERLRRLTLQLRFVATARVWAPMLERALDLGSDPVDRSDYAAALKAAGIARRPWYLAAGADGSVRILAGPDGMSRLLEGWFGPTGCCTSLLYTGSVPLPRA